MSLISELRRRNVFRVGVAYAVIGWVLLQVTDVVLPILELPEWTAKLVLFLLVIGLPLSLFLAWAFELTPEGVKRENEVDRSLSMSRQTGRKIDRLIIVVLLIALAGFAWDSIRTRDGAAPNQDPQAAARAPASSSVQEAAFQLPVIAVLPFKASGSDDGGFLAAGLHDDLLTRLAKLGAFRVISRTSMMEYASTGKNIRKIGEELGAGYILEGGVQASNQRVRVNAQLIDAAVDLNIWAEVYDRDLTASDLFDIQSELAVAIARELKTELSATDLELVSEIPTENMQAYQAYLRGLQFAESTGKIGTERDREAVEAFEEAVELDPGFAQAWAMLASARIRNSCCRYTPEQAAEVLEALARARALNPGMLESELAWSEYLYRFEKEFQQALDALAPFEEQVIGNYSALLLRAFLQRRLGQFKQGYQSLQAASRLAPRIRGVYIHLAAFAEQLDDCAAAGQHIDTLLELAPNAPEVQLSQAEFKLECHGDARRAVELTRDLDIRRVGGFGSAMSAAFMARDAQQYLAIVGAPIPVGATPDMPAWQQMNLAVLYRYLDPNPDKHDAALGAASSLIQELDDGVFSQTQLFSALKAGYSALVGDADETLRWIEEDKRRTRVDNKGDISVEVENHLYYADWLAVAGLLDEAVAELSAMLKTPGGHRFPYFDGSPVFDPLADHPGYLALRAQYGD